MGDRLLDILKDMQVFVYGSIANLPLCIGATMLLFGLFTCNYAMLFFLIGFLVATPLVATAGNKLAEWLKLGQFEITTSDVCGISTEFKTTPSATGAKEHVIISNWFAMMLFFGGYILMNAIQMVTRPEEVDNKIQSRLSLYSSMYGFNNSPILTNFFCPIVLLSPIELLIDITNPNNSKYFFFIYFIILCKNTKIILYLQIFYCFLFLF